MGAYSRRGTDTGVARSSYARGDSAGRLGNGGDGRALSGFLYAGLMISPDGGLRSSSSTAAWAILRTQPILMRLEATSTLVEHAVNGQLDKWSAMGSARGALCVVMAAGGYPEEPHKGKRSQASSAPTMMSMCSTLAPVCRTAKFSPMAAGCYVTALGIRCALHWRRACKSQIRFPSLDSDAPRYRFSRHRHQKEPALMDEPAW